MMLFLLLLVPLFSFGETCGSINYLTAKDSPFEKIPVIDQDGAGICYAVTASQLMNYHLIKTKQATTPLVHPAWAALKSSRKVLEGGFEEDAVNMTETAGICEFSKVEDALNAFGNNSGLTGNALVGFLETYAIEINKASNKSSEEHLEHAYYAAQDVASPFCSEDIIWEKIHPELASLNGTSVQIFSKLFADQCASANLRHPKIPRATTQIVQTDQDAPEKLALVRNGPIAIGYCASAWDNSGYEGQPSPRNPKEADKNCGDHSSLVVGRKMIDNKCNYLVRNSYGTGWGSWNENRKCICRHKVTREWVDECTVDKQSPEDYTVEACYMGKTQLERNLTTVTTL
ncbi:MAG: C1 family peptidase [Bacteriovoracaceae bacterium]